MTVLFGDGFSGKGTLAAYFAAEMTKRGGSVLIIDAEGHIGEWGRRINGLGGIMANFVHWQHPGGRLTLDDYRGIFDLLILDSAVYFTDSDDEVMGPSGATSMQKAIALAGVPALVLAHISKQGGKGKAYGSTFWHNVPRAAYELDSGQDGARTLICHKATDMRGKHKGQRWAVERTAHPDDDLIPIAITITEAGITFDKEEVRPIEKMLDRLHRILKEHGPMTLTGLTNLAGGNAHHNRGTLNAHPDLFISTIVPNPKGAPRHLWSVV